MTFRFDESKDFAANLESFLVHMESDDAAEELGGVGRIRDAFTGFQKHLHD